jgi:hypothetical protein
VLAGCTAQPDPVPAPGDHADAAPALPGMPAVTDPHNVYAAAGAGMLSDAARAAAPLVVEATWPIPGARQPGHGQRDRRRQPAAAVRALGPGRLRLVHGGRQLKEIAVGDGPHGLCVWPQPGRYSLGHTGVTR